MVGWLVASAAAAFRFRGFLFGNAPLLIHVPRALRGSCVRSAGAVVAAVGVVLYFLACFCCCFYYYFCFYLMFNVHHPYKCYFGWRVLYT